MEFLRKDNSPTLREGELSRRSLLGRTVKVSTTVPGWSVQSALRSLLDGKGISLGSHLYKIRMRDDHKGKSGSNRTLWFWKRGGLVILCFLFAKNQAENMTDKEEKGMKLLAKEWNGLTPDENEALIAQGEFERMEYEHD